MAVSKSGLGVLAVGALVVGIVAAVLWPRKAVPPASTQKVPGEAAGPSTKIEPPPAPRSDLTEAERARVEAIATEAREARDRLTMINRKLLQARAAVVRGNADARAALERQRAAQKRRSDAAAADVEVVTLRDKIGALNKQRSDLLARFKALDLHVAEHGKKGPAGEPPQKVAGCSYCGEFGPDAAVPPSAHQALTREESRLQEERRKAHDAHAAALQRLDAQPEVAAAIAEATKAEADFQSIVRADKTVSDLIRERDVLTEKRVALVKERADIFRPRPAPGEVISNGTVRQ